MFNYTCLYCGRKYIFTGRQSGFVNRIFTKHQSACKLRTPSERVAVNKKDEQRWRAQKPKCHIENDWNHKGLISKFAKERKRKKIKI